METFDHQGGASLDPRGLIGRIYVGDHYTLTVHTKYTSCGPHGFKIFKVFSDYKSMETLDPRGRASLTPGA